MKKEDNFTRYQPFAGAVEQFNTQVGTGVIFNVPENF
jgi:hypothetical protein